MTRRVLLAIAATMAVVILGRTLFWFVFERSGVSEVSAPAGVAGGGEAAFDQIAVVSADGLVERRSGDAAWARVQQGDALARQESIRTDESGHAVLRIGKTAQVQIAPRSQFAVAEITRTVARARLTEGRISAEVYGEGAGKLKIETVGSDAVAQTAQGTVDVLADGSGQMTVAARKGFVLLSARTKTVVVQAGYQAIAGRDAPPSEPAPAPPSLFLKVGELPSRLQRERTATIKGNTTPGAVISINGVRMQSDATGEFVAKVDLREGENRVVVTAEDAAGHLETVNLAPVTVKSSMEKVSGKARWTSKTGKVSKVKW
jgi:hypothetical protein